jgi:hypothetical protein
MQQTKTEIRRMIEKAKVGGFIHTLAWYIYLEVPPSLRHENIKGGPFHKPKNLVPVIPLLGSFDPALQYDLCLFEEMEHTADAFVLLVSWQWQGIGISFHKALTSLSVLEELKTPYYNVLTTTCDHICPGCGQVYKKYMYVYNEEEYPCPKCIPSPYPRYYICP